MLGDGMPDTKIPMGEDVTVELDFPPIQLPAIFPNLPKTESFTGTVIKSADYDPKDSLRMTAAAPLHIRVIPFNKLLKMNGKKFTYTPTVDPKKAQAPKTVQVEGSKPGKFYTLTIKADGGKSCTCPGFGFRGACKHIDNYKA